MWSLFAHLGALTGFFFPVIGNIGAPLVIWLVLRERSSFVDHHGKESLNFQITVSLVLMGFMAAMTLGMLGAIFLVGLLIMPFVLGGLAVVAVAIAYVVLAAIRAQEGIWYRYPLSLRFVR